MKRKKDHEQNIMKILYTYIKPYRILLFACLLICIIDACIEVLIAEFLKMTTNSAVNSDLKGIYKGVICMVSVFIVGVIAAYFRKYTAGRLSAETMKEIRFSIVKHISKLPITYMENKHSGDTVSKITNDVSSLQNFIENNFIFMIYLPFMFSASFVYLLFLSWKLLLIGLAVVPVSFIAIKKVVAPFSKYYKKSQEELGKANSIAQDSIGGIHIVKSFCINNLMGDRYKKFIDNSLTDSLKIVRRQTYLEPVSIILDVTPSIIFYVVGGHMAVKGEINAGQLLAFFSLAWNIIRPLTYFPFMLSNIKTAKGTLLRLTEVLNEKIEREDGKAFEVNIHENPIEFKDVFFKYNDKVSILENMNFKIAPKGKVAFVGASGAGKSTVLKLICGYYDVDCGDILLYGHPLSTWNLNSARSLMSYVSQDTYVFPGTVLENIRFAKLESTKEEIVQACKLANAHEFIEKLENGYDTFIGERGMRLSGGQRQRLSLARAILKDAPILLLDEPTSALDAESEMLVQNALEQFGENKTYIIVAHRLSTIKEADIILVMDKGSVAEAGTHSYLVQNGSLYKQLYKYQFALEMKLE